MIDERVVILECKRCGHRWIPQVVSPKQCPKCRSRYWNRDYERSDVVLERLEKGLKVGGV